MSQPGHGHAHGNHGHAHGGHGHGVKVEDGFCVRNSEEAPPMIPALKRGEGRGKVLFIDMPSGVAGDMLIAGLCDLGVPLTVVTEAVGKLELGQVELTLRPGYAGAIGCHHFLVEWKEQNKERSHREIVALIERSPLGKDEKELSLRIFERLAQAEAEVHRTQPGEVQFHEVGSVDAIVDIVGAAAALCFLGADIKASPVPLGRGFVQCRHGVLPLPAPATLLCLKGVPTVSSGLEVELVTPTGAAILATVANEFGDWFPITPEKVGFGAGTRGLPDRPNALRLVLGVLDQGARRMTHVLLETNLDDMTGEAVGHALTQVLKGGALDAWILPATMKKGRPGMVFCAIAERDQAAPVTALILEQTSSIGVRQTLISREELPRKHMQVSTPWGQVRVKVSGEGVGRKQKPEFDDCAEIASREGLPLTTVVAEVMRLCDGTS